MEAEEGEIPNWRNIYARKMYQKHRAKILERAKLNYIRNRDTLLEYSRLWYEKNKKTRAKEIKQKYYQKHKNKILDKCHTEQTCACGSIYQASFKVRHQNTKKHQAYLGGGLPHASPDLETLITTP